MMNCNLPPCNFGLWDLALPSEAAQKEQSPSAAGQPRLAWEELCALFSRRFPSIQTLTKSLLLAFLT